VYLIRYAGEGKSLIGERTIFSRTHFTSLLCTTVFEPQNVGLYKNGKSEIIFAQYAPLVKC